MSSPTLSPRQYSRITVASLCTTAELARQLLWSLPYGMDWVLKICLVGVLWVGGLAASAYVWQDRQPSLPPPENPLPLPPLEDPRPHRPERGDKKEGSQTRLDAYGNSLPPGALTCLKTERCRPFFGSSFFTFTPDGKGLLTEEDGPHFIRLIALLDKDTGKVLRRFGDFPSFRAAAIAAQGRIVAGWKIDTTSGTPEEILCVWEVATGKLLRQFKGENSSLHCELSPDGRFLAIIDADSREGKISLRLWEIATGKLLVERKFGDREIVDRALFSFFPHSVIVASTEYKTDKNKIETVCIHLRDVLTGKLLRTWEADPGKTYYSPVAFSPDGNRLIAYAAARHPQMSCINDSHCGNYVVQLLDRISGKVMPLGKAEPVAVFSPDSTIVATYGYDQARGGVCLWDASTGKLLRRLPNARFGVAGDAPIFSPDGKILAGTTNQGDIALWDVVTGKELRRCQNSDQTRGKLAFSPDGKILVGMEYIALGCWEVASGKKLPQHREFQNFVTSLAFTPDGKSVLTAEGNGVVYIWDAHSGRQRSAFPQSTPSSAPYMVGACLSPDGQILAAGLSDSNPSKPSTNIGIWDVTSGRELRRLEKPHEAYVFKDFVFPSSLPDRNFLFSPNRKFLAYGWWRPSEVSGLPAPGPAAVPAPLLLPRQGGDKHTLLWELATGKRLPHCFPGLVLAISPDGTILVTQDDQENGDIDYLWDIATGKKLGNIKMKNSSFALIFSPHGQELLIADVERLNNKAKTKIQLYPLCRDKRLGVRVGVPRTFSEVNGEVSNFAFSSDGRMLAASADHEGDSWQGNRGTAIYLWEAATGKERGRFYCYSPSQIKSLSFSPDGRRLASASWDANILIWDVTGRLDDHGRLRPVQLLEEQWAHLAGADAGRAHQAIWTLVTVGQPTVAFLAQHLHPAPIVPAKTWAQLLADLDNATFAVRQKARQQLESLGEIAESHLRQALESRPSLELRRSVDHLLARIEEQRMKPSGARLRMLRAMEVLEQIGTPEAHKLLESLSTGAPASRQTEEAKASLTRLIRRAVQP